MTNQTQNTFQVDATKTLGISSVLRETSNSLGFLTSYIECLDYTLSINDIPKLGSLVRVDVDNPHLNIVLEKADSLVGCNIGYTNLPAVVANNSVPHYVAPNVSTVQTIFNLSRHCRDRDNLEFGIGESVDLTEDLRVILYGQVIDYTFNKNPENSSPSVTVHLLLSPFNSESGTQAYAACTIHAGLDSVYEHVHHLESGSKIVEAFRPSKSMFNLKALICGE
jgi:hypothetical protein